MLEDFKAFSTIKKGKILHDDNNCPMKRGFYMKKRTLF